MRTIATALAVGALIAACGGGRSRAPFDAGGGRGDAGTGTDAGAVTDAATGADAGTVLDAAARADAAVVDAATTMDATAPIDAAAVTDAGPDAGPPVDAGPPGCTREAYYIASSVGGIVRMDPRTILSDHAIGPDATYASASAASDDVLTPSTDAYEYYVLTCTPGTYSVTWEGRVTPGSNGQVFVGYADGTYTPGTDWPFVDLRDVPDDADVVETRTGLVPDTDGRIYVRVNCTRGEVRTDLLAHTP